MRLNRLAVTGLAPLCVLLACLPASAEGASAGRSPTVAVAMVIDVSGSMNDHWEGGVKIESARQAALSILSILEAENRLPDRSYRVALIGFETEARLVQPLTSDFSLLRRNITDLGADGWTNIGAGLEVALAELSDSAHDRAFVILLSDGMTNRGRSPDEIVRWLREAINPPVPRAREGLQASLYGADYGDGVDTRGNASAAGELLEGVGYEPAVFLNQSKQVALGRLGEDVVFFFGGHANATGLWFGDAADPALRGAEVRRAAPRSLLLAVLAGCKTAQDVASSSNILRSFIDAGARVGVGFSTTVHTHHATRWRYAFWETLTQGKTVQEAAWAGTAACYFCCPLVPLLARDVVVTYPSRVAHRMGLFDLETLLELRDHQARFPRVYSVGFGDAGDLDEDLLSAIAVLTGGAYLYGSRAAELENVFLEIQHRGTGTVRGEFAGAIRAGEVIEVGRFEVGAGERELRVSLNWPGSALELRLDDPRGRRVGPGYPGLKLWEPGRPTYVVLERPKAGEWTVRLFGQQVPADGTRYHVVASTGDLPVGASRPPEFFLALACLALLALLVAPLLTGPPAAGGR